LRLGANIPPFDEDADTAIAPALRFPLRAETAIGSRLEILRWVCFLLFELNSNRGFAIRNCGSGRGRELLRALGAKCIFVALNPSTCCISLDPFYRRLEICKSLKRRRLARLLIAVPSIKF
jgi:hypothetical protein